MASTRNTLKRVRDHLNESIGVRDEVPQIRLSPVPARQDLGRRPLRKAAQINMERVVPDPDQPRKEFPEEDLNRLAKSIRNKGQLLPIHVRWSADLQRWLIISGERRWRAGKRAGLSTIDCFCHEEELPKEEILEQQLVENLLREDLKPIEEARGYAALMALNAWSGKQVAEALHVPPTRVSRALALLKLPPDIQEQVEAGQIAARSAYEISKLPNERVRRELAQLAASGKLTHQQTTNAVRKRRGKPKPKPRSTRLSFTTEAGWKVVVSSQKPGSYEEVEASLEDVLDEVRHRIKNNVQLF